MIFIYRKKQNIDIKVYRTLTSIYGMGQAKMRLFLIKLGVTFNATLFNLKRFRALQLTSLLNVIKFTLTDYIKNREIKVHFLRLTIGSYQGIKLNYNLPVNGQRTKSNARTAKRLGRSSYGIAALARAKLANLLNKKKTRKESE